MLGHGGLISLALGLEWNMVGSVVHVGSVNRCPRPGCPAGEGPVAIHVKLEPEGAQACLTNYQPHFLFSYLLWESFIVLVGTAVKKLFSCYN